MLVLINECLHARILINKTKQTEVSFDSELQSRNSNEMLVVSIYAHS